MLPRRARVAIRRLHRNFKHLPKNSLVQMLRAANAPKAYIEAARVYKCDACELSKPKPKTHKVTAPRPYSFNFEIGVDVLDVRDCNGRFYSILNVVDYGTTFQQAFVVRDSDAHGQPTSSKCPDAFHGGWV